MLQPKRKIELREGLPATVVDNTYAKKPVYRGLKKINVRNKTDKEIAAERKAKIDKATEAQKEDLIGNKNWKDVLARESAATGDQLRVSLEPNIFDDYLNPAVLVGNMAANLGSSFKRAEEEDSIMPYVTSVGTPLVMGAVGGVGTTNTRQFINNMVNPLAGVNLKKLKQIPKDYIKSLDDDLNQSLKELKAETSLYEDITKNNLSPKSTEALNRFEAIKNNNRKKIIDTEQVSKGYAELLSNKPNAEKHLKNLDNIEGNQAVTFNSKVDNIKDNKNLLYEIDVDDYINDPKFNTLDDIKKAGQSDAGLYIQQNMKPYKGKINSISFNAYGGYLGNNNNNSNNMSTYARMPYFKRNIAPTSLLGTTGTFNTAMAGIGALTPMISGLLGGNSAEEAERAMLANVLKNKKTTDTQNNIAYPINGFNDVNYYAGGGELTQQPIKGKFQTIGGKLVPLSNDAEVAVGNTHGSNKIDGQYGITLHDGNQPVAEVEDDEVIVNNDQVFSDRLKVNSTKTFADVAKKLQTKAGKLEEKLEKTNDTTDRNGFERMLAGVKMATERLFQEQETAKAVEGEKELAKMGVPLAAYGMSLFDNTNPMAGVDTGLGTYKSGTIEDEVDLKIPKTKKFKDYFLPNIIDNVTNFALTANTPKLPKPILNTPASLKTTYNVNPMLASIGRDTNAGVKDVLDNSSDSNVARANMAAVRLNGTLAKSNVLGQKENIETQLVNQDKLNKQSVSASNVATTNNYLDKSFTRKNDIQSRISGNVANLSSDIKGAQQAVMMNDYYDHDLLLSLLDDKTGAKARGLKKDPFILANPRLKAFLDNITK